MKKFSIGLSMDIDPSEYKELFIKYGEYIDYLYFSIPLGERFQTRKDLFAKYSLQDATEKIKKILNCALDYGINIELALNTYLLKKEDFFIAKQYCQKELKIVPSCIVSNLSYGIDIAAAFPDTDQIVSFNSGIKEENDLLNIPSCYNEIVISSSQIRNPVFWAKIKEYGFKTRLLLNNGCSFNCGTCKHAKDCNAIFENNIAKNGINYIYALQSIYPTEFKAEIENSLYLDGFKISNRNCTFKYLMNCLEGYITGNDDIACNYDEKYYLWGRLAHFSKYYNVINSTEVYNIKKQLWSAISLL